MTDEKLIATADEIEKMVEQVGFLPFFTCRIPGFSLEERISPEAWYCGASNGKVKWDAWNSKGMIIRSRRLVYGKFFEGKAGFISRRWFPDFCNFRRDGYDFDSRYEDGLAFSGDKRIIDYIDTHGPCGTGDIKRALNYVKGGNKGFETIITRLQMQTYILPSDYVFSRRKDGSEYGWSNCVYDVADRYWGETLCRSGYSRKPEESFARIMAYLESVLGVAARNDVARLLGKRLNK